MQNIMNFFRRIFFSRELLAVILLALVFVLIRLPGVHLPLHQDEYKWPIAVNPDQSHVIIPHPPLGEIIYRTAGYIVGFNTNFRFVPLFFGMLNLLLLYYLMRFLFGRKEATIASVIWILMYYSVLASLMVDTDGQIMPFFFLIALIGYFKLKYRSIEEKDNKKWLWIAVLFLGCIGGFFIKVSFLLAIGAIIADYVWSKRLLLDKKTVFKYLGFGIAGVIVLAALLYISADLFPFFNLHASLSYWEHFAVWKNRGWFQTGIQCVKALLYSSPLLVLLPLLTRKTTSRDVFDKVKVFLFFMSFAFLFYVVIFDFSGGALDRYWQLLILPLTVLTTVTLVAIFKEKIFNKVAIVWGTIVGLILVCLQFIPHAVPALQPKAAWIGRALSLHWNFVYPFSGGSGPLAFYVSFLFMALSWIIFIICIAVAYFKPSWRKTIIAFLIPLALIYNLVFIEEYLVGFVNGSAPHLLYPAVAFIQNDPDIGPNSVTVYNDNGGNEIMATGKYHRRLYVDPMFSLAGKVETLNTDKEFYFVLDAPRLDPTSVYVKYFASCTVIYHTVDQKMSATVYDCRRAPDVSI